MAPELQKSQNGAGWCSLSSEKISPPLPLKHVQWEADDRLFHNVDPQNATLMNAVQLISCILGSRMRPFNVDRNQGHLEPHTRN